MAVEAKRGCGYRKVGGMYLVSDPGIHMDCHRLPLNMIVCPCCGEGIKHSRGWTWIIPKSLFGECEGVGDCHKLKCCVCSPPEGKHGLIWVGKQHYTTGEFTKEAVEMGISRRINNIPRGLKIGETFVYFAHIDAGETWVDAEGELFEEKPERCPAVFYAFKPSRIEKLITKSQASDEEVEKLKEAGITPIIVPNDDPDHQNGE